MAMVGLSVVAQVEHSHGAARRLAHGDTLFDGHGDTFDGDSNNGRKSWLASIDGTRQKRQWPEEDAIYGRGD